MMIAVVCRPHRAQTGQKPSSCGTAARARAAGAVTDLGSSPARWNRLHPGDAQSAAPCSSSCGRARALQHMLEHTSNAFLELDADFIITGWNPASTTLLGWRRRMRRPLFGRLGARASLLSLSGNPQSPPAAGVRHHHPHRPAHPGRGDCRALPVRRQVRIALFCTTSRPAAGSRRSAAVPDQAITDGLPVTISVVSPEGVTCSPTRPIAATSGLDTEQMRK